MTIEKLKFYPEIYRIRARFNWEIKNGRIKRPKICSKCGKSAKNIDGHHPNYNEEFKVIWLCRSCHFKEHGKLKNKIILPLREKIRNRYAHQRISLSVESQDAPQAT